MSSAKNWDIDSDATLYAKWTWVYTVTLDMQGGYSGTGSVVAGYGELPPDISIPTRTGYNFVGYYSGSTMYYDDWGSPFVAITGDITLYAKWEAMTWDALVYFDGQYSATHTAIYGKQSISVSALPIVGRAFVEWRMAYNNSSGYEVVTTDSKVTLTPEYLLNYRNTFLLYAMYQDGECVAEGTLITLADGSQKAVEDLTGDELLLVWNLYTGKFDVAPILFIDSDLAKEYKVINLYFSDGTSTKVIGEHGFWDFDLNRYVFLNADAAQYIGHWFNKQITGTDGELAWAKVQLLDVVIQNEYTSAWSPVTYSHLCYYVNGMLSMPGGTMGLINIFEVNAETMQIDEEAFLADIAGYGLFTYEEFAETFPVPEVIFEAFGAQYFKVAIGKGLIDYETLGRLIERYSEFFIF